jgi:hypothetical protein
MPSKASSNTSPEDRKYLIDIGKDNLARAIGFVNVYDGKAKFVLTIVLALTAYFLAELPSYIDAHKTRPNNPWFVAMDAFAVGCLGFFLWAVILIILTIRPNVTQHSQKLSPLFFQSIEKMPLDHFREQMSSLDESQAVILLACQSCSAKARLRAAVY